jgi:hypothetical protein
VRALPALVLAALTGCTESVPEGAPPAARPSPSVWSRDASTAQAASSAAGPPVASSVDPEALDEILAAAARAAPRHAEARDGGAIGSDTGVPAPSHSASAPPAPEPAPSRNVNFGKPTVEPRMSDAAIERAARAQLYWPLTQRCRDRGGAILPPDAVHLEFNVDGDGYILSSTIIAKPARPEHAEAARCMHRELSTITFRAPASARGTTHTIRSDVPSVD